MNRILDMQIKDRACTICSGISGKYKSKRRCDTCSGGGNWRLAEYYKGVSYGRDLQRWRK